MIDDYPTFSGIALESWFRKRLKESFQYRQLGGWWLEKKKRGTVQTGPNDANDPCEIDIVAERLTGEVEVYEVKRNKEKYRAKRLEEKVTEMQNEIFKGKQIITGALCMADMDIIP